MSDIGKSRSALGVGITTIVTISVAVLLTTFSVLALVTARADLRLSNRAIEAAQDYYSTDGQAEAWMAELLSYIEESQVSTVKGLTDAGYTAKQLDADWTLIGKSFPIDDQRELLVQVALNRDGRLQILKWQTMSTR